MTEPSAKPSDLSDPEHELHQSVEGFLQVLGARFLSFFNYLGGIGELVAESFKRLFTRPMDFNQVIVQFHGIGILSIMLVSLIAVFTGMVLALQFVVGLKRFGLQLYAGQVVGVAITRELGPVLTALMIAGRVGSGIASELGSMEVSEQVLAIRAMGGSPISKLVIPRILVCTIATPILTTIAIWEGIMGGMMVSTMEAGVTARFYWDQVKNTVEVYDFFSGVAKTVFFGFFIGCIACYQGLKTTGGTKGVGDATTKTVVYCSIAIFISDFFLTKLFLLF
jgi:phospholipid/cholesterol/gamma-HCH transport system permease protein